ncbi:MAG: SseB family protein [Amnibacterium sp.]
MSRADSAGRPFAGRTFEASTSAWSADDGSAPPAFLAAHAAFTAGRVGPEAVVAALQDVRQLVPLLAGLGEAGEHEGRTVDNPHSHGRHAAARRAGTGERGPKAELALVTVAGPDGRRVLPAFSSAAAMAAWNPAARPVPAPARQVALGAAGDGTELVVIDPGSPTLFGLRRGAVEALARGRAWTPAWEDGDVLAALRAGVAAEPAVAAVAVGPGDPRCTLEGAEVRVVLRIRAALPGDALQAMLAGVQAAWTADDRIRDRVDSLAVRVEAA